jgi:hypothetical protein
MDPESKQLWARKIASVEKPTYEITFLVERQFENENVSQRISKTHTQPQQQQSKQQPKRPKFFLRNNDFNMP